MNKHSIMKEKRKALYDLLGGKCALCGEDLKDIWHIWYINPKNTIVTKDMVIIGDDGYMNMLPSCVPCHSKKSQESIRSITNNIDSLNKFREVIASDLWFIDHDPTFRRLKRFGVITINEEPIQFYFEKIGLKIH